ncbi:MAG: class I SAM-dependent methyltransferase [Proteobacteria bacterium]|nr:class I SAM-dependent methyltransferase [Pseudomonadota bacterium]MBU1389462.1 class I SAM-dependent methyltransferase [Pseudomonadota bacterium]MBU1541282.1 class I SAM-dependent methyltransferase [Pseudomonadota bacterium]MBU2430159.1 class I SAM-dependent methyltransferase [Pseudomonadota bacterium]
MDLTQKFEKIKKCRISNSENLLEILHLGSQPLANSLKKERNDKEDRYPLSISFCPESSLLQLNETIDKKVLFEDYVWVTGTSETAREYSVVFADRIIAVANVSTADFIVEIASNDGTFLKPFLDRGYRNILGVDPAKNLVERANKQGIRSLAEFWSSAIASELVYRHGNAKLVIARNVIPHVSDLIDVIKGIFKILREDGVGVIEFHNAGKIQEELHYDSIYHEHLCYFSIKSMTYLLNQQGLHPFHIEKSSISGGSLVIYFSKEQKDRSAELDHAIQVEEEKKVNDLMMWQAFANRAVAHRKKTIEILSSLEGKNIIGFGSSARSQTYLNYCGIHSHHMAAIIDNNPLKQGLFAPGSSIPIIDINSGLELKPDLIFILAWNFCDEIAKECLKAGYKGDFLLPFPNEPYFLRNNEIF